MTCRWSLEHLLPQTRFAWGLTIIAGAFALLIAGLAWNLLAHRLTRRAASVQPEP